MPFTDPVRLARPYLPNAGVRRDAALTAGQVGNVLPVAETQARPNRGPCPPGTEGEMNSGFRDFALDPRTGDGKPTRPEIGYYFTPRRKRDGTLTTRAVDEHGRPVPDSGLAGYYHVGVRAVERWLNIADENGRKEARNFVPVGVVGRSVDTLRAASFNSALTPAQRDAAERHLRRLYLAAPLVVRGGFKRDPIYTKGDRGGNPYECRSPERNLVGCVRTVRQVFNGDIREDDIDLGNAWVQIEIVPAVHGWDVVVLFFYPWPGETP